MLYLYDGSFEGFLTTIFEIYRRGDAAEPENIRSGGYPSTLLDMEPARIAADRAKARRVENGITAISADELNRVFFAHCHRETDSPFNSKDMMIYRYLKLLFKYKAAAVEMKANLDVRAFDDLYAQTAYEVHRFRGFVRFRECSDGSFYAPVEPDNDILLLLKGHFTHRYRNMSFCIHDTGRRKALLYDGRTACIVPMDDATVELAENEPAMQCIWKKYFENITIPERTNRKLQDGFMPRRYRKYMPEIRNDFNE